VSERQTAWLLAALLAAQLILLSVEAPSPDGPGDNVLESTLLRAVAPISHAVSTLAGGVQGLGSGWRSHRTLVEENRELKAEVDELERRLLRMDGLEAEVDRLSEALDYRQSADHELRVADVVYADHSSWMATMIVYVGEHPAEVNQPVVGDDGLVGRVVDVVPGYARVQLLSDSAAAVGAMIQRTRRQGVVRSGPNGLTLDYMPKQVDVVPGDRVVTSGIDGIYPRGLPVGTVVEVSPGEELFARIRLAQAVDFSVLDQVYLLPRRTLPEM
jgi:rod shape-determining protein MreC